MSFESSLDMRKRNDVFLTEEQRAELDGLLRSGRSMARTLTRARILLLTDRSKGQHWEDAAIIDALGTGISTIVRTRQTFCRQGLQAALYDKPRPGRPPKITGDVEAKLVMLACSDAPEGRSRWTLQMLADKLVELKYVEDITPVAIYKRLKKMNLSLGS